MWLREKKNLRSLIRFHSANKINNYNRGGGGRKKIQKNLQSKSKHMNNKCFPWVTGLRVLSLACSHSPSHLPSMPSSTVLISGLAVEEAQILIWSYSCVFLPPIPQLSGLVFFLLWEFSMIFYIFHRHRVYLVDRVDWICSLYSWWEGFGSSS